MTRRQGATSSASPTAPAATPLPASLFCYRSTQHTTVRSLSIELAYVCYSLVPVCIIDVVCSRLSICVRVRRLSVYALHLLAVVWLSIFDSATAAAHTATNDCLCCLSLLLPTLSWLSVCFCVPPPRLVQPNLLARCSHTVVRLHFSLSYRRREKLGEAAELTKKKYNVVFSSGDSQSLRDEVRLRGLK